MRDAIVPLAIVGVLASMLLPVPPWVMDFLIVTNLILALVLLMSTLYVTDTLKLSALPSMLLLATLFRLSLNIATTRNILSTGEAGKVVEAFGSVVIQGNIVVGLVIFLIITLVQFIVIAKGSERVAEVSARFTLDALPGKQMSIDADVRAGLIDFNSARTKRQDLQTESRFYGALDGAMKFIKGDAIAGIVITAINIVGGLVIGVMFIDLEIAQAVSKYTILTVGDGLVAQIPALLNSLAAGIIVTRVGRGDDNTLARELVTQLTQLKDVKVMIGLVALLLTFFPGMPTLPFITLAAMLLGGAFLGKTKEETENIPTIPFQPKPLALVKIEVGAEAAKLLHSDRKFGGKIEKFRDQIFNLFGILIPVPEFEVINELNNSYRLIVRGVPLAAVEINSESPVIDQILLSLEKLISARTVEFIDDILSRKTLDYYEQVGPELVASVVPGVITVTQLTEILKGLVREGISIRHFDVILQAIAEHGSKASNERALLEEVRVALRYVISFMHGNADHKIKAITLDPVIDLAIGKCEREGGLVDIQHIDLIAEYIRENKSSDSVLVVSKSARRLIRDFLILKGIKIPVIAYEEITEDMALDLCGHIELLEEAKRDELVEKLAA